MSTPNPPRFLPTLTEVVLPDAAPAPSPEIAPAPAPATAAMDSMSVQAVSDWQPPYVPPQQTTVAPGGQLGNDETARITRAVLDKIGPLLEQKLRSAAHELFEVQVNVVLPALHRQVEAAVQQALEETLSERINHANETRY